jgi:hypothetical protein
MQAPQQFSGGWSMRTGRQGAASNVGKQTPEFNHQPSTINYHLSPPYFCSSKSRFSQSIVPNTHVHSSRTHTFSLLLVLHLIGFSSLLDHIHGLTLTINTAIIRLHSSHSTMPSTERDHSHERSGSSVLSKLPMYVFYLIHYRQHGPSTEIYTKT